jgi:hypothetical protein
MNKFEPDLKKHCYFKDEKYPINICHDYEHKITPIPGFCKRYNKPLKTEFKIDERPDGIGHFYGQVHRFPLKLECCEFGKR